ncbi:hypothetical protein U9M48_038941 [Paspalum notatum var. saurae]|uniref:Uncharacterized protein n=1 Tax=Paspalum notatum var. saurae TaxID=547442 RepID=A0AAQ3XBK2_PASNO
MEGRLMIFGGPTLYAEKRQLKLDQREVNLVGAQAAPHYLRWSETPITFDRADHPDYVLRLGRCPLVVDPIIKSKRLTRVLMDRGSGLNLLYVHTFDTLGLPRSDIKPVQPPFHGIIPGIQAYPLGQVNLPVTFGRTDNFYTKVLRSSTFKALTTPS